MYVWFSRSQTTASSLPLSNQRSHLSAALSPLPTKSHVSKAAVVLVLRLGLAVVVVGGGGGVLAAGVVVGAVAVVVVAVAVVVVAVVAVVAVVV